MAHGSSEDMEASGLDAAAVNDWENVFSQEKGYPDFAAKFTSDLNNAMIPSMKSSLIPEFAKEAHKLFTQQAEPIRKNVETIDKKVNYLMQEMVGLRLKTRYVKSKIYENKQAILKGEAERRMNNLLFIGFPEVYNERSEDCIRKVTHEIANIPNFDMSKLNIQRCYRNGEKSLRRPRDILVQFLEYPVKQAVSAGREHFSNGIRVRQDLPGELATIQRNLMPIKRAAEVLPKYHKKVKVIMDEIKIEGKRYNLQNLDEIPLDINFGIGTFKANDSLYVYFGVLNVFSNFRWAPINIDGVIFSMNEKYIQYTKARYFGDEDTMVAIYEDENPFTIKKLGYQVRGFKKQKWDKKVYDVAYTCNKRKFEVHENFAELLINTHPRILAEGSEEEPWGCGVKLDSDDVLNRDAWPRKNGTMGDCLMQIRQELIDEREDHLSRRSGSPRTTEV